MLQNPFFDPKFRNKDNDSGWPRRLYGYVIERERRDYLLLDAVDATWFDEMSSIERPMTSDQWRSIASDAPVFAIEVIGIRSLASWAWPFKWVEIDAIPNPRGPASLYAHINGEPQRVELSQPRPIPPTTLQALRAATDLTPYIVQDTDIESRLPRNLATQVVVLDVGQAAANVVLDSDNKVLAYVDLGAPTLSNTHTWATDMKAVCIGDDPVVLLTHWHYDHFQFANLQTTTMTLDWIAPYQVLGPGPQSVMAASLGPKLKVWNGFGRLGMSGRSIELERCTGAGFNRSGIACWVKGATSTDPMLLPGDAGYSDIPSLAWRGVQAMSVAHHGGMAAGAPPAGASSSKLVRVALSYGASNTYRHPLPASISKLTKAGWVLGSFPGPAKDERRTSDLRHRVGTAKLGHISLHWPGKKPPTRICRCGCTIQPNQ